MTATIPARAPIERTEHPHVVKSADTLGGEPRVDDTRLAVRHVLRLHRDLDESPETIARTYGLTIAQVHDALSYAFDHPEEIAHHEEQNRLRTVMREQNLVLVGNRLIARKRLDDVESPTQTTIYTWETLPEELER
ncbi:MAG: DUF433 domain-containing protein [Thermomicrobiales bacterium]